MDAFSTDVIEEVLVDAKSGFWHHIGFVKHPDLVLNDGDGSEAARIFDRFGGLKVWWNNGPQVYVASYAHSVESLSANTRAFSVKLNWMNQGGGVEKSETIVDAVSCRDTDRRSVWTFSLTAEQAEYVKRATANPFGPVQWTKCS